jgi:hypothetical protein
VKNATTPSGIALQSSTIIVPKRKRQQQQQQQQQQQGEFRCEGGAVTKYRKQFLLLSP